MKKPGLQLSFHSRVSVLHEVYAKRMCLFTPLPRQVRQHDCWCHPNLRKPPPLVGGGLRIVMSESQTPACCVGDSLKECQRKHSQTTCSPRAEGLACLQAHLHTIPSVFLLREPAEEMKQGAGRGWGQGGGGGGGAFPEGGNL